MSLSQARRIVDLQAQLAAVTAERDRLRADWQREEDCRRKVEAENASLARQLFQAREALAKVPA
jgi:hypothetical protein